MKDKKGRTSRKPEIDRRAQRDVEVWRLVAHLGEQYFVDNGFIHLSQIRKPGRPTNVEPETAPVADIARSPQPVMDVASSPQLDVAASVVAAPLALDVTASTQPAPTTPHHSPERRPCSTPLSKAAREAESPANRIGREKEVAPTQVFCCADTADQIHHVVIGEF